MNQIRLLDLEITDGATQLAISEAIMYAVGQGIAPPTLRLYSWSEPVVILGVGQSASDLDLDACGRLGHRVLRRICGGTAVYHDDDEVSVDLTVPAGHRLATTDVHTGYRQFAGLLLAALESVGVYARMASVDEARHAIVDPEVRQICFASISPYEFLTDGRKLNGLCQIRRRDAISYQTAIYRRFKPDPLLASLHHDSPEVRTRRAEFLTKFVTDMNTQAGKSIHYRCLQEAIRAATEKMLGVAVEHGQLTEWELTETERLVTEKYANDEWTFRR
jgi:lipoyl(octanoyl) transferase